MIQFQFVVAVHRKILTAQNNQSFHKLNNCPIKILQRKNMICYRFHCYISHETNPLSFWENSKFKHVCVFSIWLKIFQIKSIRLKAYMASKICIRIFGDYKKENTTQGVLTSRNLINDREHRDVRTNLLITIINVNHTFVLKLDKREHFCLKLS